MIIYTCITNGYDELPDENYYDPDVKYICFSDGTIKQKDPWEFRDIPVEHECPRRLSAYPKINPHKLFPMGTKTVWIDGCYVITKQFVELSKYFFSISKRTHMRHPRKYTYLEEVMEGYMAAFNTREDVIEITKSLKEIEYDYKKYCSPVLACIWRTIDSEINEFHDLWWKWSLVGPNRDQISFDTARQLTGLEWHVHESEENYYRGVWPAVGINFDNKSSRKKIHPQKGQMDQYKNERSLLSELQDITGIIYKLYYRGIDKNFILRNIEPKLPRS